MADMVALAEEIRLLEDEARTSQRRPIEIAVAIGEHLLTAKDMLSHGEFMVWVAEECHYTPQHARRLMFLARNGTRVFHLDPGVSLRGAIASVAAELRAEQVAELDDWTDEELALRVKLEAGTAVVVNYDRHPRLIA